MLHLSQNFAQLLHFALLCGRPQLARQYFSSSLYDWTCLQNIAVVHCRLSTSVSNLVGLLPQPTQNGQGGSTLRLETGVGLPGAFVGNITARNVTCRDGWNAAYILPHQQVNGRLTLENFKSFGCLTTVDIGGGTPLPNSEFRLLRR